MTTVKVVENDSGAVPSFVDLFDNAFVVDNMPTIKLHTRHLTQPRSIANGAKVVLVCVWRFYDVHFGDALWLKAWEAPLLAPNATARMSALKDLVTGFLDQILAFLVFADIQKCWAAIMIPFLELLQTESALHIIQLITSLTSVIR